MKISDFDSKFSVLAEDVITRYQQGGLLTGDIVKFRKDALKNPKVKDMSSTYKTVIEDAAKTDLNLRVSSVKTIRPTTSNFYGGGQGAGTDAPYDYFVDLVIEYAPGLFRDPITVPIEVLDRVDTGINLAPIPDSLKRPSKSTKPQELETNDKDRRNPMKNTKLEHTPQAKDGRSNIRTPDKYNF